MNWGPGNFVVDLGEKQPEATIESSANPACNSWTFDGKKGFCTFESNGLLAGFMNESSLNL